MKTLNELISNDPAWPLLKSWAGSSISHVQLLPCAGDDGEKTLVALQVSTQSTLGAIALHSGGILVDHGWLRVLGAGHPMIFGNLRSWNHVGGERLEGVERVPGALVVAYDVLGGLFAVNGGGLEGKIGNVHYFAPDSLEWEDTDLGHSAFVNWCFSDGVGKFYGEDRWPAYHEDLKTLAPERGYLFVPPLFTSTEEPRTRKEVPMRELVASHFNFKRQLEAPSTAKA